MIRAASQLLCAAPLAICLAATPLWAQPAPETASAPSTAERQTDTPAPAAGAAAAPNERGTDTPAGEAAKPAAPGTDPWAALGLPPTPGQAGGGSDTAEDPWGFDEEVKEETWQDIVRPQAADLAITTAFFAFALFSFFRKSNPLKYTALAASVAYLGYMKGTMMSVTDIARFIDWEFPQFQYSLAWYLISGFTVATTLLWGRFYCGRICAFGALTQLMDAVVPKKIRWEPSARVERYAGYVKYGLLAGVVAYYIITKYQLFGLQRFTGVYRYVEPFWMYTGVGTTVMWSMLAVLLLATLVVRNLYCRFLCPVGAMLGVMSQVTTLFRIKRWKECNSCKICERTCEWGAIRGPQIVRSECVRCDDCERLYADEKKCVHWVVFHRKKAGLTVGASFQKT